MLNIHIDKKETTKELGILDDKINEYNEGDEDSWLS